MSLCQVVFLPFSLVLLAVVRKCSPCLTVRKSEVVVIPLLAKNVHCRLGATRFADQLFSSLSPFIYLCFLHPLPEHEQRSYWSCWPLLKDFNIPVTPCTSLLTEVSFPFFPLFFIDPGCTKPLSVFTTNSGLLCFSFIGLSAKGKHKEIPLIQEESLTQTQLSLI